MKSLFAWIANLFKNKKQDPVIIETTPKTETPVKVEVPTVKIGTDISDKLKNWDGTFADISHWEKDFNAKVYDKPILINKCTDGTSYVDDTHATRKFSCKNNGIKYVGYHFYQVGKDPLKQAEHYVASHGDFELPPILDVETDKDQTEALVKADIENVYKCLLYIEHLTGKTPILYSYKGMLDGFKLDPKFKKFPLWIARYNQSLGPIPSPWTQEDVVAWQYTDGDYVHFQYPESFKSIGDCDGNIYYKENDKLKLF